MKRPDEAASLCRDALELAREVGSRHHQAHALTTLAQTAFDTGDAEGARSMGEEALTLFRELGHRGEEAAMLGQLAELSMSAGELDEGRSRLRRALDLRLERGNQHLLGGVIWLYARLALRSGRPEVAAKLQGASRSHFAAIDNLSYLDRYYRASEDEQAVDAALDADTAARLRAHGRAMNLDRAVRLALAAVG